MMMTSSGLNESNRRLRMVNCRLKHVSVKSSFLPESSRLIACKAFSRKDYSRKKHLTIQQDTYYNIYII